MTLVADIQVRRGDFDLDASFEVPDAETVALLGPNGAGKSTVVDVLAGLVAPDDGTLRIDDTVLDRPGIHVPPEGRDIGVVFQGLLLLPHLTALDNVAFPLRARRIGKRPARRRALEFLARFDAAEHANSRPGHLSGGQAQRVALARAIVGEPRILLLDEPMSALDVGARGRIREVIGSALASFEGPRLLVTHDPVEAMTLADRIVVLEDGRITRTGTPEELRDAPGTSYVADLVGVNLFHGRLDPLGEPDATRLVVRSGGTLIGARPDGLRLDATGDASAVIRPADVVLHASPPQGSSRNVLRGPIAAIAADGERARVRLASTPPIVAEVTRDSVARLGLSVGSVAWASVKAVEVRILPD